MISTRYLRGAAAGLLFGLLALPAAAQSFRVQCPSSTTLHPNEASSTYVGPVAVTKTITRSDGSTYALSYVDNGGGIKCQQISGGDGFATMGDGTPTYLFGFGPLSGLKDMASGQPGTELPSVFKSDNSSAANLAALFVGAPINQTSQALDPLYSFNAAVGVVPDPEASTACTSTAPTACLTGHVDPRMIMDVGVMNANMPAPLMVIDEDDEFFLTLTNVGQVMRPDLFEQHTVHFHGYPNASAFYDGVPDASIAINVGGSFSYYYLAPDAGTYFWHCHISPPEHLEMGMVGQLFVRPRQNRVANGADLGVALKLQQNDPRTRCDGDVLCAAPLPATANATTGSTGVTHVTGRKYAYNDGDGSTRYDVEYPIQIHGFDPNFHFVGMTFNPESFTDLKHKYFLLNGRSYPDTVSPGTMTTQSTDGTLHASQPMPTIINIPANGRALLRISDLDVAEFQTLASIGIPMRVIGMNAKLLRDMAGKDMTYLTNSITLGGGESVDVILDATGYAAGKKFYLYTPNLDHLANDAENFGGLMTEVNICNAVDPTTKQCS
ncbi:MAG: multicopper oxidase domain-containing protein [Steroidobacteraceae bacterium]